MPNQYTTKGQPKRTRIVLVRLTDAEHAALSDRARSDNRTVSEYVRSRLQLEAGENVRQRGKGRADGRPRRMS
jgi:hypothetical protein